MPCLEEGAEEAEFTMADYGFEGNSYWCGKSIFYELAHSTEGQQNYGAGNIQSTVGETNEIVKITIVPYDSATDGKVTAFKGSNC